MTVPTPRIDYDLEVEADCITKIEFGPFVCWFVMCSDGDKLVSFQLGTGETVILSPDDQLPIVAELIRTVPNFRLSNKYHQDAFTARWDKETGPYLFPKRKGKLKRDWPDFEPDIPLAVLADWLQDHGLDKAAEVLRTHKDEICPSSDVPS